jgi:hypothetical protein
MGTVWHHSSPYHSFWVKHPNVYSLQANCNLEEAMHTNPKESKRIQKNPKDGLIQAWVKIRNIPELVDILQETPIEK